jgi:hypothetical protein
VNSVINARCVPFGDSNKVRVTVDVKPPNLELSGDVQAAHEGLIFCHIVRRTEMKPNYIEESISLEGDHNDASPHPIEGERAVEVHALVLSGLWGRRLLVLVHSAMKSASVWDLIAICGIYVMSSPMSLSGHLEILPVARRFPTISPSPRDVATWTGWLSK